MANVTRYLGLRLSTNLTNDSIYNLNRIDVLGSIYTVSSDGSVRFRSKGNLLFQANDPAIGGSGSGGTVQFGSAAAPLDSVTIYATLTQFSGLGVIDEAAGGTKDLLIRYKSDINGSVDTTAHRSIYFDLEGADRQVVLGSNFRTTGGNIVLTGPADVTLPATGTLATLAGTEVLTNKTINAPDNTVTNIANANVSATAGIVYSKLNLTNSLTNADIAAGAAIVYSKLTLVNSLVNADIAAAAAIAYSKLNLADSIVNADVKSDAAIAGTKITPTFGAQTVYTTDKVQIKNQTLNVDALATATDWTLPLADGLAGQVLKTDGSGQFSWVSVIASPLPQYAIDVGSATNERAQVDTNTVGDALVTSTGGIALKSSVLNALKAFNTDGLLTQTAANTFTGRTLTGTTNRLSVSNGNGVSGNPTVNVDTTLLPSPVLADAGKYLKTTAADTGVWTSLAFADLPTLTADRILQSSAGGAIEASGYNPSVLAKISQAQTIVVAKSGGDYTTIQAAIDYINGLGDATVLKQYAVHIYPGTYIEDLTVYPFIHLIGLVAGPAGAILVGKIDGTFVNPGDFIFISRFTQNRTITADNQYALNITGGLLMQDMFIQTPTSGDYTFKSMDLDASTFAVVLQTTAIFVDNTFDGSTKDIVALELSGAQQVVLNSWSAFMNVAASSGEIKARCTTNTGINTFSLCVIDINITKAGFGGTVINSCVKSASTGLRLSQSEQFKATSVSGGTHVAMELDSGGLSAEHLYAGTVVLSEGFTTGYTARTDVTDTHKIWLNSTSKDLGVTGTGLAVITPYVLNQTGFVQWSQVAGNYYSYNAGTREFTLLKRCTAMFKSTPVVIEGSQTVTLPADNAAYFIYANSSGILQTPTASPNFDAMILLFSILSDGTNYVVTKQTHPASFPSDVSSTIHNSLGSSLTNEASGVLDILVGANRTLEFLGATTYYDHGLNTTVADSTGVAISTIVAYTSAAGISYYAAASSVVPPIWQNSATTVQIIPDTKYYNYRVGVTHNNQLDDTAANQRAQFIIIPDTNAYNNQAAATAAITANNVASFPADVASKLEVINLGYITIQGNGAGGGTITYVKSAKQTFGVNFASGNTASAGAVTTDTTLFDKILSGADTTVQTALNTIDENAAKKETGDIAITSLPLSQSQAGAPVTGLAFSNASVRAFRASVSIYIDATADLAEIVYLYGVQVRSDWILTATSVGDESLVSFTIDSSGQVLYSSGAYAGFVSGVMKFRAWALPV